MITIQATRDGSAVTLQCDGAIVRAVYSDELAAVLPALGTVTIARASHVEPITAGVGWVADMAPSGGERLGPFPTRQAALDAERAWLRIQRGI